MAVWTAGPLAFPGSLVGLQSSDNSTGAGGAEAASPTRPAMVCQRRYRDALPHGRLSSRRLAQASSLSVVSKFQASESKGRKHRGEAWFRSWRTMTSISFCQSKSWCRPDSSGWRHRLLDGVASVPCKGQWTQGGILTGGPCCHDPPRRSPRRALFLLLAPESEGPRRLSY